MGQEILYCYKCQTRLLGSEFEKGKAFKVGGQASCPDCVKDLLASIPGATIDADPPRKLQSTARIPVASPDSSSKFKPATVRAVPAAPAPEKSRTPLIVAAVVGGAILLLVLAWALGAGGSRPRPEAPIPDTSGPVAPPSPPPKPEDPKPPPPAPALAGELREIDEKMRAGFANQEFRQIADFLEAARKRRAAPEWLSEIDLRTPQVEARARRAAIALREKAADTAELKQVREKISSWGFPAVVEEFDKALADAAGRAAKQPPIPGSTEPPLVVYDDALAPGCRNSSWGSTIDFAATSPVFEGTRSISVATQQMAAGLYIALDRSVDPAEYPYVTFALYIAEDFTGMGVALYGDWKPAGPITLDQIGGFPKAREWKRFVVPVSRFNPSAAKITGFILQVFKTGDRPLVYVDSVLFLKTAEPTVPPAPPPKAPASEAEAYRARWSQAAAKAALREYAAAQRDLEGAFAALKEDAAKSEAAADLETLKLAAQVPGDALRAIEKWPKGQKLRLEFLNGSGEREAAEGTLLAADALRISIARDAGLIDLPVAELLPSALADIFRARPDKKASDGRAAGAFCFFEGDADAGRKHWADAPPVPERLSGLAKAPSIPAEAAARRLFWAAEADFQATRRRPAAVEKFNAFLAGEPSALLARLRPYVSARLEAAKDSVFFADDLNGAGMFMMSSTPRMELVWTGSADVSATKSRDNHVEAEFYAFPGVSYRAWVWAGACCLETFDFSVQGSELSIPNPKNSKEAFSCEPGAENALPAKAPSLALKRFHSQHGGPKEPAKWDWFPVALPKYETAGTRKLRVLSTQQGFSVGAIVISSTRRDTPRETEIRDLEKIRFGTRRSANAGPTGSILHEIWHGIPGFTVEDLTKHPAFAGKPSATSTRDLFEGPRDIADNYGTRMRGYVHPPATGAYTFWISSDDCSELWISSDEFPVKKKLICSQNTAGGFRDWTRTPTSKSAPVLLAAGKRYYIEALHKEGIGNDHISVGWTLPDGTEERPIPGSRLSPWKPGR